MPAITRIIVAGYLTGELSAGQLAVYDSIADDAAGALVGQPISALNLSGLRELSDAAAAHLADHRGHLLLDGLHSVGKCALRHLAEHRYELSLNGLTELSREAAEILSEHRGRLSLDGLKALDETAAASLSRHRGRMSLGGLESVSDIVAMALADSVGGLSLNGITELGDTTAAALARHHGSLKLDGLTSLSAETASALGGHHGSLSLNGLRDLSDGAAAALASHRGRLWLNGLRDLSDGAATALAGHCGRLSLDGIVVQQPAFLTELNAGSALALVARGGDLCLNGLTELSEATARVLATGRGRLSLNGLTELSEATARALAMDRGRLLLRGLQNLSVAAALGVDLFGLADDAGNQAIMEVLPPVPMPDWLRTTTGATMLDGDFPLATILKDSVYYPSSGFDADPVVHLGGALYSFIYVDYGYQRKRVHEGLMEAFQGYRVIGIRPVSEMELVPNGWTPEPLRYRDGDLQWTSPETRFCDWMIFERRTEETDIRGPQRFSLLYLCAEGAAAFQALYTENRAFPRAVAVIQPGEAFGGNCTKFRNPEGILAMSVLCNPHGTPEFLLSGGWFGWRRWYRRPCWPEYRRLIKFFSIKAGGGVGIWQR